MYQTVPPFWRTCGFYTELIFKPMFYQLRVFMAAPSHRCTYSKYIVHFIRQIFLTFSLKHLVLQLDFKIKFFDFVNSFFCCTGWVYDCRPSSQLVGLKVRQLYLYSTFQTLRHITMLYISKILMLVLMHWIYFIWLQQSNSIIWCTVVIHS